MTNIIPAQLTLLEPQSRFGDKSLGVRLVCPQIGTAVLKGLSVPVPYFKEREDGQQYKKRSCDVPLELKTGTGILCGYVQGHKLPHKYP